MVYDESTGLKKFFLQEKPSDMIVLLKRHGTSYAGELSENADTTYSHAVKVMNKMKEVGLVTCSKKGRKKEYELTPKGNSVAGSLEQMMEAIDDLECPECGSESTLSVSEKT